MKVDDKKISSSFTVELQCVPTIIPTQLLTRFNHLVLHFFPWTFKRHSMWLTDCSYLHFSMCRTTCSMSVPSLSQQTFLSQHPPLSPLRCTLYVVPSIQSSIMKEGVFISYTTVPGSFPAWRKGERESLKMEWRNSIILFFDPPSLPSSLSLTAADFNSRAKYGSFLKMPFLCYYYYFYFFLSYQLFAHKLNERV